MSELTDVEIFRQYVATTSLDKNVEQAELHEDPFLLLRRQASWRQSKCNV